jgi:hypothetical protein
MLMVQVCRDTDLLELREQAHKRGDGWAFDDSGE